MNVPSTDLVVAFVATLGGGITGDVTYGGTSMTQTTATFTYSYGIAVIAAYCAVGTGGPADIVVNTGGNAGIVASKITGLAANALDVATSSSGSSSVPDIGTAPITSDGPVALMGGVFSANLAASWASPQPLEMGQSVAVSNGGNDWKLYEGYWLTTGASGQSTRTQMSGFTSFWLASNECVK